MLDDVWEFDPNLPEGSRWTAKAALPVAHGFVPATAIAGYIYTAGGSVISGTTLEDSTDSYKYDPVADQWTTIASVPRPVGETRAVNFNGKMWVLGGGRTDPNPSNVVNKYSPDTNTWTISPSFAVGRRNFPADTNGYTLFIAGGYDAANTIQTSMEITELCEFLATPTATSTPTATATASPVCTPFFTENFDGVAAPALPVGWTATNIVPGPSPAPVMWATTTASSDSGPNNAFVDDAATVSDKRLDSVPIAIGVGPVELTFRNNFNTEASGGIFWDGGVLEISSPNINGGDFTDVLDPTVGGSFVTGGYNWRHKFKCP